MYSVIDNAAEAETLEVNFRRDEIHCVEQLGSSLDEIASSLDEIAALSNLNC